MENTSDVMGQDRTGPCHALHMHTRLDGARGCSSHTSAHLCAPCAACICGAVRCRVMHINLHGIWGADMPGQLEPEVFTETLAAAVSSKVLRALAGKPGAARKALSKLLEVSAALLGLRAVSCGGRAALRVAVRSIGRGPRASARCRPARKCMCI